MANVLTAPTNADPNQSYLMGSPAPKAKATTWATAGDMGNSGAQLYIPGQSKMNAGDTFLGGTGTGVTDAMLGGATRVYGNSAEDTAQAYKSYQSGAATPKSTGNTYGVLEDQQANPGTRLYVPGQTQLSQGDVFLGGTGTGVTDAQLNGAQRIYGNDAQGTADAYRAYQLGQGSQPQAQQGPTIQSQIDALKASQIAQSMASLGKSRDASMSNLNAESAKIAPEYYSQRQNTSTASQLGAKNFAEFMANRGQTSSGVANQGEIASNVALQGGLGQLNTGEAAANADIFRRTTDIGNAYNSDVASAEAGAQSQALQNTINQMNLDRTFNQQTKQYDQSFGLDKSSVTGSYDGQKTMAQKAADLQAIQFEQQFGLSVGQAMGNYKGNPTLAQNAQNIQNNQFNASQAQQGSQFNRNLDQNSSQFGQTLANNQYQFGQTMSNNNMNSAADRAISQQNANTSAFSAGVGTGTVSGGSMPAAYSGWVNDAATKNGISPAILAGLIQIESGWNPNAVNKSSGATGLGQFLGSTAKDEGLSNRTDAQSSIYAAAAYLAKRIQWAGGDVNKGIMGYGEGTTAYLNKVLGASKSFSISSGGGKTTQGSTQGKMNSDDAQIEVDNQLAAGQSPGNIAMSIESQRATLEKQGVNVDALIKHVWAGLESGPGEL